LWTKAASACWESLRAFSSLATSRAPASCSNLAPRRELNPSLAAAVAWAERIMRKIDNVSGNSRLVSVPSGRYRIEQQSNIALCKNRFV
jgi:hypothetical protein